MVEHFIDRLTYMNVVATLALFIGLGGVSYAAIALPAAFRGMLPQLVCLLIWVAQPLAGK